MLVSGSIALLGSAFRSDGCGLIYHVNAVSFFATYTLFGLVLARSRIRLVIRYYEVKPSWMVTGVLVFTPLVVGMSTAVTLGYGGFVGLLGMGLVAWFIDVTPKAPKWMGTPQANLGLNIEAAPITLVKNQGIQGDVPQDLNLRAKD